MTDEPTLRDGEDDEEPAYCSLCGDPVTSSDAFCAGCGDPVGEAHDHSAGE
ncbi:MAG: hypothetical protein KKA32_18685 [Actinobacteria bacterium]|nr:hypothetical protein [Actinomycetota bacterium]